MLKSVLSVRLFAPVLLSVCAALCVAGPAYGKPPAPGAPGAIHVWAPADKHGFGTAHQLASKAWFTLRQGVAERGLLPGPKHAGVPRAAVRGRGRQGLLQRETVDDDPRHIEPLAEGVTSRVEPVPGLARVPPGHARAPAGG